MKIETSNTQLVYAAREREQVKTGGHVWEYKKTKTPPEPHEPAPLSSPETTAMRD